MSLSVLAVPERCRRGNQRREGGSVTKVVTIENLPGRSVNHNPLKKWWSRWGSNPRPLECDYSPPFRGFLFLEEISSVFDLWRLSDFLAFGSFTTEDSDKIRTTITLHHEEAFGSTLQLAPFTARNNGEFARALIARTHCNKFDLRRRSIRS
jgi:hypothetical protein